MREMNREKEEMALALAKMRITEDGVSHASSLPASSLPLEETSPVETEAEPLVSVADPAESADLPVVPSAKKSRKNKKRKQSNVADSKPVFNDDSRESIEMSHPEFVASPQEIVSHTKAMDIPATVEAAGGIDNAVKILIEHAILDADVPQWIQEGKFPTLFCYSANYLPFYQEGKCSQLWDLARDTLKRWILCATIVFGSANDDQTELYVQDSNGVVCVLRFPGRYQFKLLTMVCVVNMFYRKLEVRVEGIQWLLSPGDLATMTEQSALVELSFDQFRSLQRMIATTATRVCWNCKVPEIAKAHCNKCELALYCSRDCQVADWPKHKKCCTGTKCPPFALD